MNYEYARSLGVICFYDLAQQYFEMAHGQGNRPHSFNLENAAAMAPPIGVEAGARFGLPPAGLP